MNKTILIVAAHPDDEVLGCGATIAKHVDNGDTVVAVFMTNGVSSRNTVDIDCAKIRNQSCINALKILGVSQSKVFDFPDNMMEGIPLLDVVKAIESVISEYNPSIVYTHFSDDLNIDHRITHRAVMTACRPQSWSPVKCIYTFEVLSSTEWNSYNASKFNPNMYIDVSKMWDRKMLAIQQYSQELRPFPHSRCVEAIESLGTLRGVCVGLEKAEAFQIERIIG